MSENNRKLLVAVNPDLIDKNEAGNASLFVTGFENGELTADEFTAAILRGEAYCPQLKGSRRTENFKACNIASVDVDRDLTIEEAHANPLVSEHALLIYTTPRHTSKSHRFRVVFLLGETVLTAGRMKALNRGLARRLGGDMSATDATRISFGNRAAQVSHIGRELSPELMDELIADAQLPENTDLPERAIVSRRSFVTIGREQELQLADGRSMPLCDVPPKTRVHCPVHPDENPSAFIIENRNGVRGVYCSTCSKSYWPKTQRSDEPDPDAFVNAARSIAAAAPPEPPVEFGWSMESDVVRRERLTGCRVHFVQGQAAPPELLPGITLVRSDKGTGKTEAMRRLSAGVRSVLSISHRRTLIRGLCKRLDLVCYLDPKKGMAATATADSGADAEPFPEEGSDEL